MYFPKPLKRTCALITLFLFTFSQTGYTQQIVLDGQTQTNLTVQGNVTDVTTTTIQGNNAFNSFSRFNVDAGNVVNLHVPTRAQNLLNLVHHEQTNINGILNAIKNGRIGGNVFFANPHGIVIGANGVVNVGSLTAVTPTEDFMRNFFVSPGVPSLHAANQLLDGSVPISPNGLVSIAGEVNAIEDIKVSARDVTHSGVIQSGARFKKGSPDFSQIVNTNGLGGDVQLVFKNGDIEIKAVNDIETTGAIVTNGATILDAGNIDIHAGGDIVVKDDALISAKGQGFSSDGGNIILFADGNSTLEGDAVIDASAGTSGDGGFVEFSAAKVVTINGGEIRASAERGKAGSILLDPEILNLNVNDFTNGADKTFEADKEINVNGVTISSRQIAGGSHETAASTGDSGNLTFTAPEINFNTGSKILAHADNGFTGGDVTANATQTVTDIADQNAVTAIHVNGAKITGKDISLLAHAITTKETTELETPFQRLLTSTGLASYDGMAGVSESTADADVHVNAGSDIQASGNLTIKAQADSTAVIRTLGYTEGIVWAESIANANAKIHSGATIAANALEVEALINNDLEARAVAAGVGIGSEVTFAMSNLESTSDAHIESGATVNANQVGVKAENINSSKTIATSVSVGTNFFGLAVGVADVASTADAHIGADLTVPGDVTIEAKTELTENKVSTDASESTILSYASKGLSGLGGLIGKKKGKKKDDANLNPISIAAGFSFAESTNTASAFIEDNTTLKADGNITVKAEALDLPILKSQGEGGEAAASIGGAVASGDYFNNAYAYIGANANVDSKMKIMLDAHTMIDRPLSGGIHSFDDILNLFDFDTLDFDLELFTTRTASEADGQKAGLAGSVNIVTFDQDAHAYIGEGAQINQDAAFQTAQQDIELKSRTEVDTVNLHGGKGMAGGAYSEVEYISSTKAYIADDANVHSALDLLLDAKSVENILNIAIAGANGGKLGVDVSFSLISKDSKTYAYIEETADVFAGRDVLLKANNTISDWNIAGAIVLNDNVGVGASIAINEITAETKAFVGDLDDTSTSDSGRVESGNSIEIDATSDHSINSYSLAAAAPTPGITKKQKAAKEGKGNFGLGVSANVSLNTINATTQAFISDAVTIVSNFVLGLNAMNTAAIQAVAGAVAVATNPSSTGLAGSWGENTINNITQTFLDNVHVKDEALDGTFTVIDLDATTTGENLAVTVGMSGGATAGIAGSVSNNLTGENDKTEAYIKDSTIDKANVDVTAKNTRDFNAGAGSLAIGLGKAGFGTGVALNTISSPTRAYLENTTLTEANSVIVHAISDNDVGAYSASIGGSANTGLSGALSFNTLKEEAVTDAFIKDSTIASAVNNVKVMAEEDTKINSLAGSGAGGTTVGFGAMFAYNNVDNKVQARIEDSSVTAEGDVEVTSNSIGFTEIVSVGGAGGVGGTGVAAGVAINANDKKVTATIDNSTVTANKNVKVAADNSDIFRIFGGTIGGGAAFGFGGSAAVNLIRTKVHAFIENNSNVNAFANGDAIEINSGNFTDTGESEKENRKGVAVNATSKKDINTLMANGGGGGTGGIAAQVTVTTLEDNISAKIQSSTINDNSAAASSEQIVDVNASTHTDIDTTGGGLAFGGTAGVGAVSDTQVISTQTSASIVPFSDVQAKSDIDITANADLKTQSIVIGAGGGGSAGIAGSVAVTHLRQITEAVSFGATLKSGGDLNVKATDDSEVDIIAGAAAFGGVGGVGGSVAVTKYNNHVRALLAGDIDAAGATKVQTDATRDSFHYVLAGAGGGTAGVAASISITLDDSTNTARLFDADVNHDETFGGGNQNVLVEAKDDVTVANASGGAAAGGTVGVGAANDIIIQREFVTATIDTGADVRAKEDVTVKAETTKDFDSATIAGSGGGAVGISGAVTVVSLGNKLDDDAKSEISDTPTFVHSQATDSPTGNLGEDEFADDAEARSDNNASGADVDFSINTEFTNTNTTSAHVNFDSSVTAGGHLNVSAVNNTDLEVLNGGIGIGLSIAGAGAGVSVVNSNMLVNASLDDSSKGFRAGNNIQVEAELNETLSNKTFAGGAGLWGGIGAAVAVTNTTSTAQALLTNGVNLHDAQLVKLDAKSEHDLVSEAWGPVNIGAGAIGVTSANISDKSDTRASVEDSAQIGSEANRVSDLEISAESTNDASAVSVAGAGGVVAVGVADATSVLEPTITVSIGKNVDVHASNDVILKGKNISENFAESTGAQVAAASGGATLAEAIIKPTLRTFVDDNSVINAGGDVELQTIFNVSETTGNPLTSKKAKATASSGVVSIVGGSGSDADAETSADIETYIGQNVDVDTEGNVSLQSKAHNSSEAIADGLVIGIALGVGASLADALTNSTTKTYIQNDGQINAANLNIQTENNDEARAEAIAAGGGIIGSGVGSDAFASVNPDSQATVGANETVTVGGNATITVNTQTNADAIAKGTGIAGIAVGVSKAEGKATPKLQAKIEDGAHFNVGNDVTLLAGLNYDANGNILDANIVQAEASSSAGGLASGLGSDAKAESSGEVFTEVAVGVTIAAGGDVNVLGFSRQNVDAYADGNAIGIGAAFGSTQSFAKITNTIHTLFAGNIILAGITLLDILVLGDIPDNVRVASESDLYANSFAKGGNGGILSFGGTEAKTEIFNNENKNTTELGAGSSILANETVDVEALLTIFGASETTVTAGGAITANTTEARTKIISDNFLVINELASIAANIVNIRAVVKSLTGKAKAFSKTIAASSNSTANTYVDIESDTKVTVKSGADIFGVEELNIISTHEEVVLDTDAKATIEAGLTGSLKTNAHGDLDTNSDIVIEEGANLTSTSILLESESDRTEGNFVRTSDTDAQTVVKWVLTTVDVLVKSVSKIPFIGKLIKWVWKRVRKWVATFLNSVESATITGGDPQTNNSIVMNGNIRQLSSLSPQIVINPDGSIDSGPNVSAFIDGGDIVINGIVNDLVGDIKLNTPSGDILGNGNIFLNKTYETVDIVNNSDLNLRINGISVTAESEAEPDLEFFADLDLSDFTVQSEVNFSDITVQNNSASNIIFAGKIDNPSGSLNVFNQNGDILTTANGLLEVNKLSLNASNGNIGTGAAPVTVNMVRDAADAEVEAVANGQINLDATLIEFIGSDEAIDSSYVIDSGIFTHVLSGDDINLNLEDGVAFLLSADPGGAPTPLTVIGKYVFQSLVGAGDVTIDAPLNSPILDIAGLIASGLELIQFVINADGSIDLSQINYSSLIDEEKVVLENITTKGGNVTITGGDIEGSGEIKVLDGFAQVDIENNSDLDLLVNDIDIEDPVVGKVVIDGAEQTLPSVFNGVSISTYGADEGVVDVLNDSTSDIFLSGKIQNTSGLNFINNTGGNIFVGSGAPPIILKDNTFLQALTGDIGAPGSPIVVDSEGVLNMFALNNIYLQDVGDLLADSIVAQNGLIDLLVSGDADIGSISAPGSITINVLGSSLEIDTIDPTTINLIVAQEGGVAEVKNTLVSDKVTVRADNILLHEVTHATDQNILHFDLAGNDNGLADYVDVQAYSDAAKVIVDNIKTDQGFFGANNVNRLEVLNAVVGTQLKLNNSERAITLTYKFKLFNQFGKKLEYKEKPFFFILDDRKYETDARPFFFLLLGPFKPRPVVAPFLSPTPPSSPVTPFGPKLPAAPKAPTVPKTPLTPVVPVLPTAPTLPGGNLLSEGGQGSNLIAMN